jgi:hypothetical protein
VSVPAAGPCQTNIPTSKKERIKSRSFLLQILRNHSFSSRHSEGDIRAMSPENTPFQAIFQAESLKDILPASTIWILHFVQNDNLCALRAVGVAF